MKTILVTGGAGFIGSRLCERLVAEAKSSDKQDVGEQGHGEVQDAYKIISLDNYFTGSRENHVPGVEYREGHTKDIEQLVPETPDIVYHLGEYSRVEKSLTEPALVWDLNKDGTFGVLEFCRKKNVKLLYAGSSTKFGDGGLGRDQSPYAWTKATNTELVRNYGAWYEMPYAITYFYNVYGPGERAGTYGTVIEIFRQKYLKGEPLLVTAPGTQKRNFTHIDDIVDGLLLVGEKGFGDDFGLGDARAFSILEVAKMFGTEITMMPEVPGNRMSSEINTSKAEALGWKIRKSLEEYITDSKEKV